ncbi:MAG TPA: inositol monophosphatase family protein [Bacteroidales bacterium]|nr:inositol monophosphatase family protein [Bacteroidales bacterium]
MADLKEITEKMGFIAREAGEFIRKESLKFDISSKEVKGINNFVSYVDKKSEELIVSRLRLLIPEASFKTEEGTAESSAGAKYCWVVDPLDGTTNFMHGLPPYAVSIGFMEDDEYVAGVVYEINLDEMFSAWKGGGAWLNNKPIHVSDASRLSESLVATGFPYYNFSKMDRYMECFSWFCQNTHGVRRLGSAATDIVYIACGRFEGFYEYGLYPWDIAAAIIILREAGGRVSDFSGNEKSLNGDEIVASTGKIFPEMLKIVNQFMKS